MNDYAKVASIDVLRDFRATLCLFAEKAATALDEAAAEVQRTQMWLQQDRYRYWQQQVRVCSEKAVRAKLGGA